jgi:hypothetical protein
MSMDEMIEFTAEMVCDIHADTIALYEEMEGIPEC